MQRQKQKQKEEKGELTINRLEDEVHICLRWLSEIEKRVRMSNRGIQDSKDVL